MVKKKKKTLEYRRYKQLFLLGVMFCMVLFLAIFAVATISSVTLNSPADLSNSTTTLVEFNCSATATSATLVNMSLWNNVSGSWENVNSTDIVYLSATGLNYPTNDPSATTGKNGMRIVIGASDISITKITKHADDGATRGYVYSNSGGNLGSVLGNVSFSGNNATFSSPITLTAGLTYYIVVDKAGASYNPRRSSESPPSWNITGEGFEWTGGVYDNVSYTTYGWSINSITTTKTSATYVFTDTIAGTTKWNCQACDSDANCGFASSNRTVNLEEIAPTISVENPSGTLDYGEVGKTETLNVTFTDVNLASCWYNYNGINTTIPGCQTGVKNSTTFTLVNQKNMTLYANDSIGNLNSSFISWDYKIFATADYYKETTLSGATNTFNMTVESASQITKAYLNYNNTNYLGSINSTGGSYILSRNQIAPTVSTPTNISFYWNITRADGFNYLVDSQNQTVNPITINSTCAGNYLINNFTLVDEITQTKIVAADYNTSIKVEFILYTLDRTQQLSNYSAEFLAVNPAAVCINTNLSGGESYSLDTQVKYEAINYSTEFYHIENYTLNSSSLNQNTTLYDLPDANTQRFELLVRDTSYLPIEGALIKIERKYIQNGTFQITEIPKTDAKGITTASLETDDVLYNFYIYDGGTLVSSFLNVVAICQTPLVSKCQIDFNAFQTGIDLYNYEDGDDFNFTLGYNYTSRIVTSVFEIPSGSPSLIELIVTKEDSLGTSICSDSITSASGTLSCLVPSNFGNATVIAKVYKDSIEQGRGTIKLDQKSSDIFGVILVVLSIFVLMTLIGVGISDNPIITAVFLFVGVLLLFAMNLVQNKGFVGATATILFIGIALILIIIKAARRT